MTTDNFKITSMDLFQGGYSCGWEDGFMFGAFVFFFAYILLVILLFFILIGRKK